MIDIKVDNSKIYESEGVLNEIKGNSFISTT